MVVLLLFVLVHLLLTLTGDNEDQTHGIKAAAFVQCKRHFVKSSSNAGDEASVVLDKISKDGNYGYNAGTGEYGDMIEMGILDPAKVTRTALQAAGSIAGLMITTEAMVADKPAEGGGSCNA